MSNIKGELIIEDKIWFNSPTRCWFRMCGFSPHQVKLMKTARLIDITITDHKSNMKFEGVIRISDGGIQKIDDQEHLLEAIGVDDYKLLEKTLLNLLADKDLRTVKPLRKLFAKYFRSG